MLFTYSVSALKINQVMQNPPLELVTFYVGTPDKVLYVCGTVQYCSGRCEILYLKIKLP